MESFWKHSISVAVIAQILVSRKNPRAIEQLFAAGMLHVSAGWHCSATLPIPCPGSLPKRPVRNFLHVLEREALGFDHGELGGRLLERWNFPITLQGLY